MNSVFIQVPATTANFGPGFDCIGIALNLHNQVDAKWKGHMSLSGSVEDFTQFLMLQSKLEIEGQGASELKEEGVSLFFRSLAEILQPHQLIPVDLCLHLENEIPLARGLGSSAACIISALCLGREVLREAGVQVSLSELAQIAVSIEGHPDNVLPALYGGACLNLLDSAESSLTIPFAIPEELDFILAIPEFRLSTKVARTALPTSFSLAEVVQNSALLGGLLLALADKDFSHLSRLLQGPLHVPYRSKLIPGFDQVQEAALSAGAQAFTISGSGPTLLALAIANPRQVGEAMCSAFAAHGIESKYVTSKVERTGALVQRKDDQKL